MPHPLKALVFDAYGTLFDVHSVTALAEQLFPGKGAALSQLWRTKQLEYTWLRTLMGRYESFDTVTEAGLRYAAQALKLEASEAQLKHLIAQYVHLTPFADARATLQALKPKQLAILSNGAPGTLGALCANSGIGPLLDAVLSVDSLRVFKPTPQVYQLACDELKLAKEEIGFVSSNGWDAAGAKSFGFTVFWINRASAPTEVLPAKPDHVVSNLNDLLGLVASA
jgi:2-haloacid dehalogenase